MNVHFILFIWFLSKQFYMSKIVQQKHSMQFEVNLNSLKSDSSVSVAMESFCSFCVSKWTKTSQMSCARIIFRRDLWAPLKVNIQFKVYKIKLQFQVVTVIPLVLYRLPIEHHYPSLFSTGVRQFLTPGKSSTLKQRGYCMIACEQRGYCVMACESLSSHINVFYYIESIKYSRRYLYMYM